MSTGGQFPRDLGNRPHCPLHERRKNRPPGALPRSAHIRIDPCVSFVLPEGNADGILQHAAVSPEIPAFWWPEPRPTRDWRIAALEEGALNSNLPLRSTGLIFWRATLVSSTVSLQSLPSFSRVLRFVPTRLEAYSIHSLSQSGHCYSRTTVYREGQHEAPTLQFRCTLRVRLSCQS